MMLVLFVLLVNMRSPWGGGGGSCCLLTALRPVFIRRWGLLDSLNHAHIGQASPQLNCVETCHIYIGMIFVASSVLTNWMNDIGPVTSTRASPCLWCPLYPTRIALPHYNKYWSLETTFSWGHCSIGECFVEKKMGKTEGVGNRDIVELT